jgi:hypothetical protein
VCFRMRTEPEVRQMISELIKITDHEGRYVAKAVIAALNNVLNGPIADTGECACMGPSGCCVCQMLVLARRPVSETTES